MINKNFIRQYIAEQSVLPKIDLALSISEQRSRNILATNDWYKDLYIDPNVDDVKRMLQIGLGHWASTHFILSLLLEHVTTVEYDNQFVERYSPELDPDFERIIQGDSTVVHADIDETFDALFIDGNHSYEYVKKDYENYRDKVKPGGIIAFHDVNFEGDRYGSPQVLRETGLDWTFISHSAEVGIAYRIKE